MSSLAIDHLVVTANTLENGVAYVQQKLGVTMQPGGKHIRMGTHNALLRLGERVYLEVIAADPTVSAPDRPRWFQLDELHPESTPRLATWVVRTTDIRTTVSALDPSPGCIERMARGDLNWQITIPQDGRLVCDGVMPSLIEWEGGSHPAEFLKDCGVTLKQLTAHHSRAADIQEQLERAGFQGTFSVLPSSQTFESFLTAEFQTPFGTRTF